MADKEMITLPRDTVAKMFDIICESMDWGSGFLDTDEVITIREVAVMLGADVMEATPASQRAYFVHTFSPRIRGANEFPRDEASYQAYKDYWDKQDAYWKQHYEGTCRWCGKREIDFPHQDVIPSSSE